MKKFFHKLLPCILIAILVLISMPDSFGHTVVFASAISSNTAENNTGHLARSNIGLQALNTNSNISLNMRSAKIVKGHKVRLKVLNLPANYTVSFHSSNTKIASVSSTGKIKGKKNGETTVVATIKHNSRTIRKLTCSVQVGPAAVSIVIPKSKLTLTLGKTGYVSYIIKSSNSVEVPVFKSSNKKVATVSKTGVITTHSAGKATITATIANGKSDQLTVVVNKKSAKK